MMQPNTWRQRLLNRRVGLGVVLVIMIKTLLEHVLDVACGYRLSEILRLPNLLKPISDLTSAHKKTPSAPWVPGGLGTPQ